MLANIINAIHLMFVRTKQHPNFGPNAVVYFIIKKNLSKFNTAKVLQLSNHTLKGQFVITHTIRQNKIPELLDITVIKTLSIKMLCLQKIACLNIFVKT